jgi:NAD(P)H-nitrite reductase large subunit
VTKSPAAPNLKTDSTYKKLVTRDNLLKGFILIGEVARAGIYTSLIREKTPLDTVDFELIKEKPQLMAFAAKERAVKLGGAKA